VASLTVPYTLRERADRDAGRFQFTHGRSPESGAAADCSRTIALFLDCLITRRPSFEHPAADRRLNRHIEQLARNQAAQAVGQLATLDRCCLGMDDRRQRIDRFTVDQQVELDQFGRSVADQGVVEAGVAPSTRFQFVIEVSQDF